MNPLNTYVPGWKQNVVPVPYAFNTFCTFELGDTETPEQVAGAVVVVVVVAGPVVVVAGVVVVMVVSGATVVVESHDEIAWQLAQSGTSAWAAMLPNANTARSAAKDNDATRRTTSLRLAGIGPLRWWNADP
jgi:hypothetical protein